jgi:pyruvate kinase
MTQSRPDYREALLTKTKIVATVGPACDSRDQLRRLAIAGVDVFRLNFAHGKHEALRAVIAAIREVSAELDRPIGLLADLAGPKIRLGPLPEEGLYLDPGTRYAFVREPDDTDPHTLTSNYDGLIDDLDVGDRVLLADGTVSLRVEEKQADRAICSVEQPGHLRSRQGINLPGSTLRVPSLTEKDRADLVFALEQRLDFVSLSFVRKADDLRELRSLIEQHGTDAPPFLVAKIEKPQALDDLDDILSESDAVMVARGDLGVEVDIVRVPTLQKEIIRRCNRRRVPVITATQMLDSMQHSELPTRAETSDVANAVLDGTDAVMLSGESAIGKYPVESVTMMSRIVREAEPKVVPRRELPLGVVSRNAATQMTKAVTAGAIQAAEYLDANLIVVLTRSGRTAIAVSELRSGIPILALTDNARTARRLCLAWGVTPVATDVCNAPTAELIAFVEGWGRRHEVLVPGNRIVFVGTSNWSLEGKNQMLVHVVPG